MTGQNIAVAGHFSCKNLNLTCHLSLPAYYLMAQNGLKHPCFQSVPLLLMHFLLFMPSLKTTLVMGMLTGIPPIRACAA